jgi:hypothetical protein
MGRMHEKVEFVISFTVDFEVTQSMLDEFHSSSNRTDTVIVRKITAYEKTLKRFLSTLNNISKIQIENSLDTTL